MTSWLPPTSPGVSTRAHPQGLSVSRHDGVGAIARFARDIDRLNAASERPNLFLSSEFLSRYALRNEYFLPGSGEFSLVVRREGQVVGVAPLRRTKMPILRTGLGKVALTAPRIEFLAPLDTEQPHFLCASEDDDSVATAIIDHLCHEERGWGMLELVGQPRGNAIHRAMHAAAAGDWRFRVRDIEVEPISELALSWPDSKSYFRSLTKHMRSNISRQVRRLYAAGEVELVLARGPEATSAWFDCYRDVDDRSWKSNTPASISRHPRRVALYRDLVQGLAGLEPAFAGVVLDGVLIGGLVLGSNQATCPDRHGLWALEMAYDRTHAALGPGQLLLMLGISEGIERRSAFLNMLQNFAYYKHRWGAGQIDVVNVQLIRHLSLPAARAGARDVRKWWLERTQNAKRSDATGAAPAASAAAGDRSEAEPAQDPGNTTPVDVERARSLTQAAFDRAGTGLRRLDRHAARSYLPFDLE